MMICMRKPTRPRIAIDCEEIDAIATTLMKIYTGQTPRDAFLKMIQEALQPYYAEAQKIIDKRKKSGN